MLHDFLRRTVRFSLADSVLVASVEKLRYVSHHVSHLTPHDPHPTQRLLPFLLLSSQQNTPLLSLALFPNQAMEEELTSPHQIHHIFTGVRWRTMPASFSTTSTISSSPET